MEVISYLLAFVFGVTVFVSVAVLAFSLVLCFAPFLAVAVLFLKYYIYSWFFPGMLKKLQEEWNSTPPELNY